jgi:hypothetical protein
LKALYFDEQFDEALQLADPALRNSASPTDLENMVRRAQQQLGTLKKLKADSYLMTLGRSMELFYVGTYERGTLYHRLVLVGDASSGYKVSGVWFQREPYPPSSLRRQFTEDIFV